MVMGWVMVIGIRFWGAARRPPARPPREVTGALPRPAGVPWPLGRGRRRISVIRDVAMFAMLAGKAE
jgi:hypothetical protein